MRRFLIFAIALAPSFAIADPLIPGPSQSGYDAALAAQADGWGRVQRALLSRPLGFGLEGYASRPEARAAIEAFAAASGEDFQAITGMHPYAVLDLYGEHGDLGMFGGVQAAGEAFRYQVLRDSGAPAADVDAARAALERAMDGLHWQAQITGEAGAVARGIARIMPEGSDPAIPGPVPELVALFDGSGSPLPIHKEPTWRADNSGELPFLIWIDDCSKDQLDGYVFALGAIFDVAVDDPTVDPVRMQRLIDDALAIGTRLMRRVPVSDTAMADLVIVDPDGRPTTFHDLSAEEGAPGVVTRQPLNGFNGVMGLGIVRTLYHITGDESLGRFYYEDLIARRHYLRPIRSTVGLIYIGTQTNYSNVNMAFVAIYGVLRYESDPAIAAEMRSILGEELYAPGVDRDAQGLALPFFDFLFAGFHGGLDAAATTAIAEGTQTLRDARAAPAWEADVVNCDAAETAALSCLAIDGTTTIQLAGTLGRGDALVARDPVPIALRPPSNFEHRSDPHRVNGSGGDRLDPQGDLHAAYWMGRMLEASADPLANLSPHARAAPPPLPDAGMAVDGGHGTTASGCSCRTAPSAPSTIPVALAALALVQASRRRCARRGGAR